MRILLRTLIVLLILACGFATYAYFNAAQILSNNLSEKFQVPVKVEQVDFKPASISIQNLTVSNPPKAKEPTAFKARQIDITAPYRAYLKDPILIDTVLIQDVYVDVEIYDQSKTKGNWQTLLANLKRDRTKFFVLEKTSVIKNLILTNIHIQIIMPDGKKHVVPLIKRLEFKDVSSEKGIPIDEITEIVMQKLMGNLFLQKSIQTIIEAPLNLLRGILPIKNEHIISN